MSITGHLISFGVCYFLETTANRAGSALRDALRNQWTDHSQTIPKALVKAHDRAWDAVGLALAGNSVFDWFKDRFRDADMKAIREQIRAFVERTPTGLETTPAEVRRQAAAEWSRLRKGGWFTASLDTAPDMQRYGEPTTLIADAKQVVQDTAASLRSEAPHLAQLLTACPLDGMPLLTVAFAFFFRREVETDEQLAHGLTFTYLQQISERQQEGLSVLDFRTIGILDQINVLFETLAQGFAEQAAKQEAIHGDVIETKETVQQLEADVRELLNRLESQSARKDGTWGSITVEEQAMLLRVLRVSRRNPNAFSTDLLDRLGDSMTTERMYDEAQQMHEAAAAAAHANANRDAEAEQHFKAYLSACDRADWPKAAESLWAAAQLRPDLYQPFHPTDFEFIRILGAGAFGTVFHCRNEWNEDVAIKSFRSALGGTEAWTLRAVQHPAIIGVRSRGYGNKDQKTRPYIVMEYFPGVTLDQFTAENHPLPIDEFVFIARQVAEAVHAAHSLPTPIYHCDIKPANIMVLRPSTGPLVVKVIDFGLAKRTGAVLTSRGVPKSKMSTSEMSHAGTERYAPPEQTGESSAAIGAYSDVYAWGKTFIETLFGHLQPGDEEWEVDEIPELYRTNLKRLFAQCVRPSIDPKSRFPRLQSFAPVLETLRALDVAEQTNIAQREREAQEAERQRQEAIAQREREAQEAERQRREAQEATRLAQAERQRQEAIAQRKRDAKEAEQQRQQAIAQRERDSKEAERQRLEAIAQHERDTKEAERRRLADQEAARLAAERLAEEERQCQEAAAERERQENAWSEADAEAIANDPFHPARTRTPGEIVEVMLNGTLPMRFAWIPPGTFMMGSNHPEAMKIDWCRKTEQPVHQVTLTQGFFMGVYPVTQAQWQAIMKSDPSQCKGANRPVEQVSWDDCQTFCQKLTPMLRAQGIKATAQLPTEAQWEYACRAGTTSEFWFGDVINTNLVNYDGTYQWNSSPKGAYRQQTTDVGSVGNKNPWGLFDVHGNVWEWCQDAFEHQFYVRLPQVDPINDNYQTNGRVLRGGSWRGYPNSCRSAYRSGGGRDSRGISIGCRVCFRLDG